MQLTQREEQFFKAMAGNGSAPPPVSREERFMADIVSGESSGLSPLTAEERALNGLVGKIGGGGGDSDFSIAKVTLVATDDPTYETVSDLPVYWPIIENNMLLVTNPNSKIFEIPAEFNIPLFKGVFKSMGFEPIPIETIVSTSGDVSYDDDAEEWTVTGDFTIVVGAVK